MIPIPFIICDVIKSSAKPNDLKVIATFRNDKRKNFKILIIKHVNIWKYIFQINHIKAPVSTGNSSVDIQFSLKSIMECRVS